MSAKDYRPQTWDGVVGQPVEEIRAFIEHERPDFLFYGPSGTGKTTVAYLIAKKVQGSPDELVELNASDERGIDAVRLSINPVVNQTTLSGAPMVVFLDEMDSMTKEAQEALRQPMEQGHAIFVLACNDYDAVHDALKSRCYEYEFGALSKAAIKERITQIAESEGVDLSGQHLSAIADAAEGDMRNAIQRYKQVSRGAYTVDEPGEPGNYERSARAFLDE